MSFVLAMTARILVFINGPQNAYAVKLGYNEQLGTGQICSL